MSELYLFSGSIHALKDGAVAPAALVAPVLALVGALACACFIKVFGAVFLGTPRSEPASPAHEAPWSMRTPLLLLGGACLFLGLAPGSVTPLLEAATGAWAGLDASALYRIELPFVSMSGLVLAAIALAGLLTMALRARARRTGTVASAPTWDCGFAAPVRRAQYTASSLGWSLVGLFAFVLRPAQRDARPGGAFPGRSSYASEVEDPALMHLCQPIASAVADRFVRLRQLQTGRIQGYIFYVAAMTLVLLLAVLPALVLLRRFLSR